jgi:uncharacterized membrane protein
MVDFVIPALIGLFLLFGPWIFIIILFNRAKKIRFEIQSLRQEIRREHSDQTIAAEAPTALPPEQEPKAEETEEPKEAEPGEAEKPEAVAEEEVEAAAPAPEEETVTPAATAGPWAAAEAAGAPAAVAATATEDLEKTLASRWLIWLGAVAISLAGVFLTAYVIEQGWLGPTTRIVLGFALGIALTLAGEWIRRRPFEQAIATVRPDYVPLALSSAGIFTMYASIYVGNALYALYTPLFAFLLLAIIGLGAVALSLLQGWFVAFLGLLGSFLTPLLVPSEAPSAWTLFPYLLTVLAASMAVVRYKAWWLLGYASLVCATVWCLYWLSVVYASSDAAVIGIYILAVCAVFQLVRFGYPESGQPIATQPDAIRQDIQRLHPGEQAGWAGFLAAALMLFALVRADNYGIAALAALFAFTLGSLWTARRNVAFDLVFVLAALLVLLLFASWHIFEIADTAAWMAPEITEFGQPRGPILPPALQTYSVAAIVFGGLFGIGGFVALWGVRRVSIFAGTSAFVPVLVFAIAYWRFLEFGHDLRWAAIALVLALVALLAAGVVEKYRDREKLRVALGLYAAAVVAFISLGLAMTLEEAWLSVALSLQLPALAWIHGRLKVDLLRAIAAVVAAIVLVRLVLNENVYDYAIDRGGLFNWILYGYGVPCVAFFFAARAFAKSANDALVAVLETGALVFGVLLVSYEIRFWVTGSLDASYDSLLEQSLQSIAWLAIGTGLLVRGEKIRISTVPVLTAGAYLLLAIAAAQVLALQVASNNPLIWASTSVGRWPLLDLLLLAYLVPACFAFALVPAFNKRGEARLANISGVIGLFLLLVFISLEVKHWFQGEYLNWRFESDAENYAISVAWLVYALALLAGGIFFRKTALRYGSLAVLLITVLKVFLGDMGGLTGLYRVASFLGLGLCLVGIGYLYQRFVFADTAQAAAGGQAGEEGKSEDKPGTA